MCKYSAPGTNGSAGAAFEAFNNQLIRQIQKVVLGQTLPAVRMGKEVTALAKYMKMSGWISSSPIFDL